MVRFRHRSGATNDASARVLLAIDDERLRGGLSESLRRAAYDVVPLTTTRELREALVKLKEEPHDCPVVAVVVDLRQPGHGAIEGADLLEQHGHRIALIALSSHPKSSALALSGRR